MSIFPNFKSKQLSLSHKSGVAVLILATFFSCTGSRSEDSSMDPVLNGTIQYPFVDETRPLGIEPPEEKFIIRSAIGNKEYSVEIPGGARDFDVQVPLADLGSSDEFDPVAGKRPDHLSSPVSTDSEMIATLPKIDLEKPTDAAIMDGAFGVGNADGPTQAPSYTLGMAKINTHYRNRQYEYALIELNALIAFYPSSPKLHKMKGTVLIKMRNMALAELAWIKALELEPKDRGLRNALSKLQKRIIAAGNGAQPLPTTESMEIPLPVGTTPPPKEKALSH
jgi:hypothetical protein